MYIYAVIIIHNGRFRFLSSMCRLNCSKMWINAIDSNKFVDIVYIIDFSKAFDTVSQNQNQN